MSAAKENIKVRYIIIETKAVARIGYNGFLFPHSYSGDGLDGTHLCLHLITHAEKETRYSLLCFNTVSYTKTERAILFKCLRKIFKSNQSGVLKKFLSVYSL